MENRCGGVTTSQRTNASMGTVRHIAGMTWKGVRRISKIRRQLPARRAPPPRRSDHPREQDSIGWKPTPVSSMSRSAPSAPRKPTERRDGETARAEVDASIEPTTAGRPSAIGQGRNASRPHPLARRGARRRRRRPEAEASQQASRATTRGVRPARGARDVRSRRGANTPQRH